MLHAVSKYTHCIVEVGSYFHNAVCILLLILSRSQPDDDPMGSKHVKCKGKGKGNVHPRTGHEGPEGEDRYSSTLPLTSALDGVGGQRHAPAALPPGKTRYPLYRRQGGPQDRSRRVRKISPRPGFDPRTVQPVANRYTD